MRQLMRIGGGVLEGVLKVLVNLARLCWFILVIFFFAWKFGPLVMVLPDILRIPAALVLMLCIGIVSRGVPLTLGLLFDFCLEKFDASQDWPPPD